MNISTTCGKYAENTRSIQKEEKAELPNCKEERHKASQECLIEEAKMKRFLKLKPQVREWLPMEMPDYRINLKKRFSNGASVELFGKSE